MVPPLSGRLDRLAPTESDLRVEEDYLREQVGYICAISEVIGTDLFLFV